MESPDRLSSAIVGSLIAHGALFAAFLLFGADQIAVHLPKRSGNTGSTSIRFTVTEARSQRSEHPPLKPRVNPSMISKSTSAITQSAIAQNIETKSEAPSPQLEVQGGSGEPHLLSEYLFGLRRLIEENKVYPSLSRRLGETGQVLVSLEVLRDGTLEEIKIKKSSQYARLDQAALETVSGVEKYVPIPDSVTQQKLSVVVPIEFAL